MVKNEKEGILLESGTNEIEVMKFTVMGEFYGINVAKVQEIIMSEKVKPMPHANPAVEGIFKPRDELITVINLAKYLTGDDRENGPRDLFIVTNFNKMTVASGVSVSCGFVSASREDFASSANSPRLRESFVISLAISSIFMVESRFISSFVRFWF